MKLPSATGLWPAFWMLGSNISTVGWPASGEVDIMENVLTAPLGATKIASTIHPYPTFVEVGRKAADQFLKSRLTPLAKRLFTTLYARQRGDAA